MTRNRGKVRLLWLVGMALAGCSGPQSALDPAGKSAELIAGLFWWMTGGAIVAWIGTLALAAWSLRRPLAGTDGRRGRMLIAIAGAAVPTVVLTGLLIYGLSIMPPMLASAPAGSLRIAVSGERWWWRVVYLPANGEPVVLANEIRLPVGQPVEFELTSPDVIHSFWIPSLGGKMDMIPGRKNRLALHPTRTGIFRGVCAEYCGDSHALMAFSVEVMEEAAFAEWLAQQARPAAVPTEAIALRGREQFLSNGCSACHTVRGTEADGVVGPDLTHVGSRLSLGAGILPNDAPTFRRWLKKTGEIKPGVEMPHFGMLPPEELDALAAYLESLQ